jgi:transposase-like protein
MKDPYETCPKCKEDSVEEITKLICSETKKTIYREFRCNNCGWQYLLNRNGEIAYI